jgi:hypothetical protein
MNNEVLFEESVIIGFSSPDDVQLAPLADLGVPEFAIATSGSADRLDLEAATTDDYTGSRYHLAQFLLEGQDFM